MFEFVRANDLISSEMIDFLFVLQYLARSKQLNSPEVLHPRKLALNPVRLFCQTSVNSRL